MGLALDELHDDDQQFEEKGLVFLVSPSVEKMLKNYEGVEISYRNYPWGGQIRCSVAGSNGSC